MVEVLRRESRVSFVSVTQQFNTTTSMGRLMLNVLLSFAQFEREITGERIRDKIAASKRKGMWMGGLPPLGYDVEDRKLVVNEGEAQTVRHIFHATATAIGPGAQSRTGSAGSEQGSEAADVRTARPAASRLARGSLYLMLQNPIYRGETVHKTRATPANTTLSLTSAFGTKSRPSCTPTGSNGLMAAVTTARACWSAFCLMRRASG